MAVIQDPFHGLIDGVLQGHAIAQQLHQQSLQDELFERRKQQEAREAQLQDLDTQMKFSQYGRPVNPGSNMVEQSTSGTLPGVAGLPDQTYGTNYARPVDKARLLKAKLSDGREIQTEAYTPEEFQKRATDTAMAGKVGEFSLQQQMADAVRQHQLQVEGRPAPAALVSRGLARPGELMLPKDILSTLSQIQTLEAPKYEKVGADESLVGIPKSQPFSLNAPDAAGGEQEPTQPDSLGVDTPWTPPAPREAAGPTQDGNPLMVAAAPGQQARADFISRVKAAGQPVAPTAATTAPTTLTAAFTGQPKDKPNQTADNLQWIAAHDPDPQRRADAKTAIAGILKEKIASRPVTNNTFQVPTGAGGVATAGRMTIDQVPPEYRDQVQQVLSYRSALPANSKTNKTNQAINYYVSRVGAPDPATGKRGYNAGDFANRNAWMRSVDAGPVMQSIVAMNTLMAHTGHLWEGAEKLDNSAFQKYNTFANWLQANLGSDQAKPFRIARLGVSEELAKLLKGGVATKDEIEQWMHEIDASDSPAQLKTTVQTLVSMARDRISKLEEQHQFVMDEPPSQPFIRPAAQQVYDRIMGTGQPAPAAGGNPYRK